MMPFHPTLSSLPRLLVRRLIVLLAVFGLVFTIGGCGSTQDPDPYKEQESRELRELQEKIPSYYLTAKEIGDGYKLQKRAYSRLEIERCMQRSVPSDYISSYYASYKNPDKRREVIVMAHKFDKSEFIFYGETAASALQDYNKVCNKDDKWDNKVGDTNYWLIVRSSRVEGLSYGAFGFRATEWRPKDEGVIPYPPTQKQLAIDKHIASNSGAYAYGRIGKYIVTVFIENDTQEPPSEQELKHLWNMQVEKVLKHIEKERL